MNSGPNGRALRAIRLTFALPLLLTAGLFLLAACSDTPSNSGPVARANLVVMTDPVTGKEVYTTATEAYGAKNFFSQENLRETTFSGDTTPRFGDTQSRGIFGFVQTEPLNNGPTAARSADQGYLAELFEASPDITPLAPAEVAGGLWQPRYDDRPQVSLNFDDESISAVVQNILGGILGANFLLGDTVEGTITFRSEERFSRAQLVQVLADILARSGYLIQYINGVYHVGTPEELEQLATLRGNATVEGSDIRTIRVARGSAEDLVDLLNVLLPSGNAVTAVPGTNNLAVRGDPTQFDAIENLVNTLIDTGISRQTVSVVPLRESAPETVATEMTQFYEARGFEGITIIPLEARQALLIAAESRQTVNAARQLAREFDVDRRDRPTLRVVQLTHLPAPDMASQLTQIFGDGAQVAPPAETNGNQSNILAAARDLANPGAAAAEDDGPAAGQVAVSTPGGGDISIVADSRNNALLIRSTYAEFIRIQEVVRALDMPLAQVAIEATIIEVDITDQLQYGVQTFLQGAGFSFRSSTAAGPADPGGAGLVGVITGSGSTSVSAVITALQSVTNVRVISSPYVSVVDGGTSRLTVADQIPFITASQTSNSQGAVTVTQEVETRDVGVILEVTPQIRPNNNVLLDIIQEVSSARNLETVAGQNPVIAQRSVRSQITVDSGFTVLLGGLITERDDNSENGVPVLRKVPVVGNLFGTTANNLTRSELLILITPRVVRNSSSLSHLTEKLRLSTSLR